MTEDEARSWLRDRHGDEAVVRLHALVGLITAEQTIQNLISRSTIATIWARHIVDSAQLLEHVSSRGTWIDIGSGAGFPGLVVALLREDAVKLVEPRRLRADFLQRAINERGLHNATVVAAPAADLDSQAAAVVSARAVAKIGQIFAWSRNFANLRTQFVLPRGRTFASELAQVKQNWQGVFHVERSGTSPEAGIVVATEIARR